MILPQNRQLVGFNLYSECALSSLPHLTLVFALQVVNKDLDITGDDAVWQAAFDFCKSMEQLNLKCFIGF